jgi:glyceraldehyde-3-phosphate dehydrogenase (NAD(P))
VELAREAAKEEVLEVLRRAPRIAFARAADGLGALDAIEELVNDLGRPRNDLWETVIWEDIVSIAGRELFLCQQVDNQAIVIPENVDAIRALGGVERAGAASIAKTDRALGLVKDFQQPFTSAAGGRPGPYCFPRSPAGAAERPRA